MRNKAQILRDIALAESDLVDLREELKNFERKVSRKKSDSYHKRKSMLKQAAPLMEELIEVGDLIEVTGAKSGKYKRVVKLSKGRVYGETFYCGVVYGSSVYYKRERVRDKEQNLTGYRSVQVEDETKITNHGTDKVVALLQRGETKWITAKDLVDNSTE